VAELPWRCPLERCRLPLQQAPGRWVCSAGHAFDQAREGYTSLLPVHHRRAAEPGDAAASVEARRRWLDRPWEAELLAPLLTLLRQQGPGPGARHLDVGCGVGWHLHWLSATLGWRGFGLELSRKAAGLAARQPSRPQIVTANADRLLPCADDAFDAVSTITARQPWPELRRVVAPGGLLFAVVPGPEDLAELRQATQGQARPDDRREALRRGGAGFRLVAEARLTLRVEADAEAWEQASLATYRGRLAHRPDGRQGPLTLQRDVALWRRPTKSEEGG
jgi:23S rRNA (guanine745-N1)-methyltransferase